MNIFLFKIPKATTAITLLIYDEDISNHMSSQHSVTLRTGK
jgi:hypothetical protein